MSDSAVLLTVLACREGSTWVVQAIEQDIATQGDVLLEAIIDLGRMFDVRDHLIATTPNVVNVGPAPIEYQQAFLAGAPLGVLPLGTARICRVHIGESPFARNGRPSV